MFTAIAATRLLLMSVLQRQSARRIQVEISLYGYLFLL